LERQQREPLLLRVDDAADLLGISRSMCYELISEGRLPATRLGAAVRINREALVAQIERDTSRPPAA
jgi:excisionase family DNA binding protein